MVRTEIRVPAWMVTCAGVFMPACFAGCGSLGSELVDGFGWSLAALSESYLSETHVSEVVLLHRGADLEADLTLRATDDLALNQAATLQFQRIGLPKGTPPAQGNDQSAIQLLTSR